MAMGISGLMADKNLRPITDPNPVEVIEDLKSLPDNILAEYAQDRTNPNATYALTVLMSRKRAKDALVKEDMPETTVAEDVIADVSGAPQTQQGFGGASMFVPEQQKQQYLAQQLMQQAGPQGTQPIDMQGINTPAPGPEELMAVGGITRLPTSNIGQNYAGGGIVAFQNGGDVGGANFGFNNLVGLNDQEINDLLKLAKEEKEYKVKSPTEKGIKNLTFDQRLKDEANKLGDSIAGPFGNSFGMMEDYKPEGIKTNAEVKEQIDKILAEEKELKSPTKNFDDGRTTDQIATDIMGLESTDTSIDGRNTLPPTALSTKGIQGLQERFDKLKSRYENQDKSLEEIGRDVQAAYSQFGVDQNVFGGLAADIEKDRQQLGKSRGEAADLAFIEAGLLIAGGTSPYALANLKEAAPAVRNYGVQLQNLRGEDRALKTMELQIKGAEQAGKLGMADKAMALQDSARKQLLEIDKSQLDADQRMAIAQLQADASLQAALIQANSKDSYILLDQAKRDPNFYTVVTGPGGKKMRQFNTEKFMELIKPYGQSSYNSLIGNLNKEYNDQASDILKGDEFRKMYPTVESYINSITSQTGAFRPRQDQSTPGTQGKIVDFNSLIKTP
jgi:hypothetical protein